MTHVVTHCKTSLACVNEHRRGVASRRLVPPLPVSLVFAGMLLSLCGAGARAATFDCVIDPSLTLKLGSPVPTILDKVEVDRGDFVKQGQVIARLQSTVEQAVVTLGQA